MVLSTNKLVNGVYINNCREKNFVMGRLKYLVDRQGGVTLFPLS